MKYGLNRKDKEYALIYRKAKEVASDLDLNTCITGKTEDGGRNRWILANGYWDDGGVWMDDKHWRDG